MLQGWSHLLCHCSPVSAPSPALLLVQPGWCLCPPCTGLANSAPFSKKWYKGWLCSTSPSLHSHSLGQTPPMAGALQPWCRWVAGFIPLHPAFQHSISYCPAELLIHTVPKPLAAARLPWLCCWSCCEQPRVVGEHFPAEPGLLGLC